MQAASRGGASVQAAGAAASAAAAGPQLQPLQRVAGALRGALADGKSLYRGVLSAAGGAGIIIGAFFAFYSTSKQLLRERTDLPEGTVAFIAGAIAAVGSSVVKVPIAVCIRSVQAGVYPNALVAAKSVVQKAGWTGLFTGFLPTLLEDVPDMAVKFAAYETLRAVHMRLHHQERPSTLEDLVMGGVAGSAAAAATTPLDVVKTRMMCNASERPTVMQAARGILAERAGLSSFFRGVGPRALSNGLNSAIFYMWFELLRAKLAEVLAERQRQRQQAAGQAIPALLVGQTATQLAAGAVSRPGGSSGGSGHQAVASCALRPLPCMAVAGGSDANASSTASDASSSGGGSCCGQGTQASSSSAAKPKASDLPLARELPTAEAGAEAAGSGRAILGSRLEARGRSSEGLGVGCGRIACLSLALPLSRPILGEGLAGTACAAWFG